LDSRPAAEVGIFWFVQQPGRPPRLIGSGVPVGEGARYPDYINYPGEHSQHWPDAIPHLPTFFRGHEHKDWPRGRVLYNTVTHAFEVYLNEQLQLPAFEAEIIAYFNLPESATSFGSDPHYSEVRFTLGSERPH
jgi:hypothetical protein